MICLPCRSAADLATGRDGTPIEAGQGLAFAYELAVRLHEDCHGCCCQHRPLPITPTLPDPVRDRMEEYLSLAPQEADFGYANRVVPARLDVAGHEPSRGGEHG